MLEPGAQISGTLSTRLACGLLLFGLVMAASPLHAESIALSANASEILGGLSISNGDAAQYDTGSGIGTPLFLETNFSGSANVDAFDVLPNGHFVISTAAGETLGGLSFANADLAEYDPISDSATLLFSQTNFSGAADIDAVSVLANGHIVLSTVANETLGGLSFRDGDLIKYDPIGDTATLLFNEDLLSGNSDIDGADVLVDGRILLSTRSGATLAGLTFSKGDVVIYDPVLAQAQLLVAESTAFAGSANVDAVSLISAPEPSTLGLLGVACLLLFAARSRRAQSINL